MNQFIYSARIISFISGIILTLAGILSLISSIFNISMAGQQGIQVAGGIFFSALTITCGVLGILSKASRDEKKQNTFLKINGYSLLFFLFVFPFMIVVTAPFFLLLVVFILGVSGLWITTVLRHRPDKHSVLD